MENLDIAEMELPCNDELIDYLDVLRRLREIDQNKSCGVDAIHPVVLKNCAESIALPLTIIMKSSFNKSELPI